MIRRYGGTARCPDSAKSEALDLGFRKVTQATARAEGSTVVATVAWRAAEGTTAGTLGLKKIGPVWRIDEDLGCVTPGCNP
jgi:hypothetical protein